MYAGSKVVVKQSHDDSRPSDARLRIGVVVGVLVVLTITYIAGKLQLRLASGLIFGLTSVIPH